MVQTLSIVPAEEVTEEKRIAENSRVGQGLCKASVNYLRTAINEIKTRHTTHLVECKSCGKVKDPTRSPKDKEDERKKMGVREPRMERKEGPAPLQPVSVGVFVSLVASRT